MDKTEIKEMVKKELVEGILKTQNFYIVGNWKMNKTKQEVITFLDKMLENDFKDKNHIVIIPSNPYLYLFEKKLRYSKMTYGVQNVHPESEGAFTGELSISQARDFGAKYAIIGHSERRNIFKEDDEFISEKVKQCIKNNITPILCVGEDLTKRENNTYKSFIMDQINKDLSKINAKDFNRLIIAYEPIWAIGTGRTATPDQVEETHVFIREYLEKQYGESGKKIPLLYGGSVKPSNVLELALANAVSGFLIGGASLDADSFIKINNILNG